jgi:hypothetical protein
MQPRQTLEFSPAPPWAERPYLAIPLVAELLGRTVSGIYGMLRDGRLRGVHVAGRTMVVTESVLALLNSAIPYRPGRRVVGPRTEATP